MCSIEQHSRNWIASEMLGRELSRVNGELKEARNIGLNCSNN